jgi:asparagine synthase (glutamine-hydrolysing)
VSAIYGTFDLRGHAPEAVSLALMDAALASAGPDGKGCWMGGPVALGTRALNVTPGARVEQYPTRGPDDVCILVSDARLDNRAELGHACGIEPEALSGLSDSHLILAAYLRWGDGCAQRMLGDFAFALWDRRDQSVFCARDQLGVKPFYYFFRPRFLFAFASQMHGLLSHPLVPRRLNEGAVGDQLILRTSDLDTTFFVECYRLPPAHTMRVHAGGLQLTRFWSPTGSADVRFPSDLDYVLACRELLEQSIRDRVDTSARVGAHVTGGLDSSSVACLAARELSAADDVCHLYTWYAPPGPETNPAEGELPFVAAVCRQIGVPLGRPSMSPEAIADVMLLHTGPPDRMAPHPSSWGMHELMRKDRIGVVLSGWGGDELCSFNGRGYYADLAIRGRWRRLTADLHSAGTMSGATFLGALRSRVLLPLLPDSAWERLRRRRGGPYVGDATTFRYIRPEFIDRHQLDERVRDCVRRELPGVRANQLRLLANGHLVGRLEEWSAAGAQCGIDYRHPLLDRRLVEFCIGLPPEQYVRTGRHRYLLRRAIEGLVPDCLPWDRDKNDPVGVRHNISQHQGVWPRLRQPLEEFGQTPEVAAMLNVPSMQRDLEKLCNQGLGSLEPYERHGFRLAFNAAAFVHRHGSARGVNPVGSREEDGSVGEAATHRRSNP